MAAVQWVFCMWEILLLLYKVKFDSTCMGASASQFCLCIMVQLLHCPLAVSHVHKTYPIWRSWFPMNLLDVQGHWYAVRLFSFKPNGRPLLIIPWQYAPTLPRDIRLMMRSTGFWNSALPFHFWRWSLHQVISSLDTWFWEVKALYNCCETIACFFGFCRCLKCGGRAMWGKNRSEWRWSGDPETLSIPVLKSVEDLLAIFSNLSQLFPLQLEGKVPGIF